MATRGKAAASTPDVPRNTILEGDALSVLRGLPSRSVQCVITSPPYYGLRDYGTPGQYGLEPTLDGYLDRMVAVFDEVFRVLRPDGVCWLNIGDSYANDTKWGGNGSGPDSKNYTSGAGGYVGQKAKRHTGFKPKDLMLVPFRLALALQAAGWWVRSDIIWHKPTAMPEPVTDRPTVAHEHVFLLTRAERYYYDAEAIREPLQPKTLTVYGTKRRATGNDALGRVKASNFGETMAERRPRLSANGELAGANKRTVWTVHSEPFPDSHFATFPTALVRPMVLAGSRPGDLILDPFLGSGTTAIVALQHGRDYLGIELNPAYAAMARQRIAEEGRPVVLPRKQRQQMRKARVTQASLLESGVSA